MVRSVCPAAAVAAPLERVWELLVEPDEYGVWIDGRVAAVEPPGRARPGQVVRVVTRALGRSWAVPLRVVEVDEARHRLAFDVELPFGVRERSTISCSPVDAAVTRVQFG